MYIVPWPNLPYGKMGARLNQAKGSAIGFGQTFAGSRTAPCHTFVN